MNEINKEEIEKVGDYYRKAEEFRKKIEILLQNTVVEIIWTKDQRFGFEIINPYKKYWQQSKRKDSATVLKKEPLKKHNIYCNYIVEGKCIKSEYYFNEIIDAFSYMDRTKNEEIEFVYTSKLQLVAVSCYKFFNTIPEYIIAYRAFDYTVVHFKHTNDLLTSFSCLEATQQGQKITESISELNYAEDGSVNMSETYIR